MASIHALLYTYCGREIASSCTLYKGTHTGIICFFKGQKVGFLGTAYFVGVLIGSVAWGWVSDVWGRRPVLLLGSIGAASSQLLFGFRLISIRLLH